MKPAKSSPTQEAGPGNPSLSELLAAYKSSKGHFDELAGVVSNGALPGPEDTTQNIAAIPFITRDWGDFFATLRDDTAADMNQRSMALARQIRDNGITYNVYADENGPQRPWSLDLFPLLVDAASWQHIEAGVLQRVRLLERVMADVYGPQELLASGFLPPALVHGHPGYLRAMHGIRPVGGRYLHIAAFDMAHGPDGNWWVVGQRTQAPSGLGYLLENRLAISAQFGTAFDSLRVQRLASTYRALMDSLRTLSPMGMDAHLALLTPGPYNETYFEHAYLARYLGLTLVEGSDLLVRDERLFLKTLKGLVPVHGLLKRVDDQYMDPLELRADSTLGVPGLLQAIRAGNVLVANTPGSAFLESPALLGFLPALSRHLFDEELRLPALPTWWCGESSAMFDAMVRLQECAIKPTYPGSSSHASFDAVLGARQTPQLLNEWAGRVARHPEEHTVQAYTPLSQMPTWQAEPDKQPGLVPRSVMLRVFAVSDGEQGWRVLPGGLARVASSSQEITSMQHGGSSADVWALTTGEVDHATLLHPHLTPESLMQRKRLVTSRAAENLFWLGRYTERTENALRLARLTLECLHGEDPSGVPLLTWLGQMAVANTLVLPGVPTPLQAPRVFERALIDSLGSTRNATSVGFYLRALKMAASSVRERLSQEHWRIITRAEEVLFARFAEHRQRGDFPVQQALQILKDTSDHMAAITGAQTDRMTRDDGWRLLSIGRHIERLGFLSTALNQALACKSLETDSGFDAMLELFDNAITFHAEFQQSRDMAAMIDLLVIDRDNPRSVSWVAHTLRGRLAKLAGSDANQLSPLALKVPNPNAWGLAQLCEVAPDLVTPAMAGTSGATPQYELLRSVLQQCGNAAYEVSEDISATYFTHAGLSNHSVGFL
ncbi:circularly permuted type 2 ATP-grasp protein [Rhodoferax sp. U11-2br]|uniref:circularly permuted type 2 ATP-grasp protein n=1 Tax=Rhodoferax sp. U11-2br TaxID=2838878 RepID=UPI001BEA9866|nr:circularly permuted type 2 ATP-grasp protein [Rhodoferax sp. U11-2br]MBT3065425.1 circularly permuted type 2 ATP-grasp protein [Rhodoferax sp. U11-2br]